MVKQNVLVWYIGCAVLGVPFYKLTRGEIGVSLAYQRENKNQLEMLMWIVSCKWLIFLNFLFHISMPTTNHKC